MAYDFSGILRCGDNAYYMEKGAVITRNKDDAPYSESDIYMRKYDKGYTLYLPRSYGQFGGIDVTQGPKETEQEFITRLIEYAQNIAEKSTTVWHKKGEDHDGLGLAIPSADKNQLYTFLKGSPGSSIQDVDTYIAIDKECIEFCSGDERVAFIPLKGRGEVSYSQAVDELMCSMGVSLAQNDMESDGLMGVVKKDGHTYLAKITLNAGAHIELLRECNEKIGATYIKRQPFMKISYSKDNKHAIVVGAYCESYGRMATMLGKTCSVDELDDTILYYAINMMERVDNVIEKSGFTDELGSKEPSEVKILGVSEENARIADSLMDKGQTRLVNLTIGEAESQNIDVENLSL